MFESVVSSNGVVATVKCKPCVICGEPSILTLDEEKLRRWIQGEKVQDVFPEMTSDEREVLISGTHGPCWKELWKDSDW